MAHALSFGALRDLVAEVNDISLSLTEGRTKEFEFTDSTNCQFAALQLAVSIRKTADHLNQKIKIYSTDDALLALAEESKLEHIFDPKPVQELQDV